MGKGEGGGGLPSVYSAVMVTLTCRIPCSDDRRPNMKKTWWGVGMGSGGGGGCAECSGHTFTSGTGHLYFRLTKFERSL